METTKKWSKMLLAGMLAMVLTFGLVFTGCDFGNDDGDNDNKNTPVEATVSLWPVYANTNIDPSKVALVLNVGSWASDVSGDIASWFIFDPADAAVTATTSLPNDGLTVTFAKDGGYRGKVTINPDRLEAIKAKTSINGSLTIGTNNAQDINYVDPNATASIKFKWRASGEVTGPQSFATSPGPVTIGPINNGVDSLVITTAKTAAQTLTKGGANENLVTLGVDGAAQTITVDTSGIGDNGGSVAFTVTVSETGKNAIVYNITVTVAVAVIPLTVDTWTEGIYAPSGEQWYSFTATANTQYIHINGDISDYVNAQLYESDRTTAIGSAEGASKSWYLSRTVTSGQTYYIKVKTDSNYVSTYKLAFNTSAGQPGSPAVPTLSAAASGTGGISLTWNAVEGADVYELYRSTEAEGTYTSIRTKRAETSYTDESVTAGQTRYYKVRAISAAGDVGAQSAYAFATATNTVGFPPSSSTPMTEGTWADGTLAARGEQWFTFTATAATQYIHVLFGSLDYVSVQLYDSTGALVGVANSLSKPNYGSNTKNINRAVTSGQTYYVKVWPAIAVESGTYKLAFNTSTTAPAE
jgi:hypothetical protein